MIYIVRSSDNGVLVNGTLRQFMVNHWWGTRWRGKQWRRWGERAQKRGRGDWWLSCDGTGGKEMIATDVSRTETNDRCWAWGSGDFFLYGWGTCLVVQFCVSRVEREGSSLFQRPVFTVVVVVNCRLRQGIVITYETSSVCCAKFIKRTHNGDVLPVWVSPKECSAKFG
jgi:hypothetical protein